MAPSESVLPSARSSSTVSSIAYQRYAAAFRRRQPLIQGAPAGRAAASPPSGRGFIRRMRDTLCRAARYLAAPMRWGKEPELPRPGDRLGAAVNVELGVDVAQVRPDRVGRNEQLGGDLGSLEVAGQVPDHAQLRRAEFVQEGSTLTLRLCRLTRAHVPDS